MSSFTLQFGSCGDAAADEALIDLDGSTLDQAKVQAALMYAGASFRRTPPTSFRILAHGQTEVYRFPETG
jgi:hypothetical protein